MWKQWAQHELSALMEVSDNVNQILQYPYRKRRPPMVQILDLFVESSEIFFIIIIVIFCLDVFWKEVQKKF